MRDPEKTYSGSQVRDRKGTESRIRIRNTASMYYAMLGIRIRRIRMFLGLPDPDTLVRGTDPAPDPSFIKLK
jgi:hypothetical protein